MENKEEIVKALLPVLQMTRSFFDLTDLEYHKTGDLEEVIATFRNGYRKGVNVTLDSGAAMILDIIHRIG